MPVLIPIDLKKDILRNTILILILVYMSPSSEKYYKNVLKTPISSGGGGGLSNCQNRIFQPFL